MTKYLSVVIAIIAVWLLVASEGKRQKQKKNRGKAFDPSVIFHALSADDNTGVTGDFDKVYEYTKDVVTGKENNGGKHKKRHNKQKHNKRNNKGSSRKKQNTSCCQNGGLCVIGAFCHCPSGFEGRYCELEVKTRNCGPVKHEEMLREGCALCQCMDGILHCLPGVYSECEDGQIEPIFYNFNEEVKPTMTATTYETLNTGTDVKQDPILQKLREMEEQKEREKSSNTAQTTTNSNLLLLIVLWWTLIVTLVRVKK